MDKYKCLAHMAIYFLSIITCDIKWHFSVSGPGRNTYLCVVLYFSSEHFKYVWTQIHNDHFQFLLNVYTITYKNIQAHETKQPQYLKKFKFFILLKLSPIFPWFKSCKKPMRLEECGNFWREKLYDSLLDIKWRNFSFSSSDFYLWDLLFSFSHSYSSAFQK